MGPFFLALLVFIPLVEIALFIYVGGFLGFWLTMGIVVLTAIIGIKALKALGLKALAQTRSEIASGHFPVDNVFDTFCLIVAGALLIMPGFFTDIVGFLLFVRFFRLLFKTMTINTFVFQTNRDPEHQSTQNDKYATTIDGEFEEIVKPSKKKQPPNLPID